jgi:hypothetical protein
MPMRPDHSSHGHPLPPFSLIRPSLSPSACLPAAGGVEAEELLALEACKEAEIATTLFDSCEQDAPFYWDASPENYMSYKKRDLSLEEEGEGVMV